VERLTALLAWTVAPPANWPPIVPEPVLLMRVNVLPTLGVPVKTRLSGAELREAVPETTN
jgi:hypothetical protein